VGRLCSRNLRINSTALMVIDSVRFCFRFLAEKVTVASLSSLMRLLAIATRWV